MKLSKELPPNWSLLNTAFPNAKEFKAIFAYGDTIYSPFGQEVSADLYVHESVHSKQQGDNPDAWWSKYIQNKNFRLKEETEAYAVQYKFVKERMSGEWSEYLLDQVSLALSSDLYNLGISYGEARSKIRNFAKGLE